MNKDNVNISLDFYNRLIKAKEIAEYEAKEDIEDKVNEKIDELMNHHILIEKESYFFMSTIKRIEVITNDDALKMSIEKSKEEYHAKLGDILEVEKRYNNAIDQMKDVKWYDLLFGTKELDL